MMVHYRCNIFHCLTTILSSIFCLVYAQNHLNNIVYRHHLKIYDCSFHTPIYIFRSPEEGHDPRPPLINNVDYLDLRFNSATKQYEVWISNKEKLTPKFHFQITHFKNETFLLKVSINVQVDSCNNLHGVNNDCTIVISILSSVILLLFASLAVSLILLKSRGFKFNVKLWNHYHDNDDSKDKKNAAFDSNSSFENDNSLDINSNRISNTFDTLQGSIDTRKDSESSSSDGSPVPPLRMPRKSSLKPPRTEAYPTPKEVEIDMSVLPVVRRKSMVTFIDEPKVSET